jgi:putative DNA methylase
MGARLMAIVAEGNRGRIYLPPDEAHERIAASAQPTWAPEQSLPRDPRNFWTVDYGLTTFADLFTPRQLVALTTFSDLVLEARAKALEDARAAGMAPDPTPLADGGTGAQAYADALAVYLACAVDKVANLGSSICSWMSDRGAFRETFARQAIPMVWDYAEANPFCEAGGNLLTPLEKIAMAVADAPARVGGHLAVGDARDSLMHSDDSLCATDPPYYDNIGYADLSDFFYVWLRRALRDAFPREFSTVLVPKAQELVATPYRFGDGKDEAEAFFIEGMSRAIQNMARASMPEIPVTFYYAFKQAEVEREGVASTGWATFLEAVLAAGFQVDGTWPVRTESAGRIIAKGSNALASSIVLVCRKRPADAPSVTRGEFLRALRAELPAALHTLQEAAIAPVDMAQASIGPGMAVFSRYQEVLEADDTPMSVREALRIINAELDEYLARQEGDYDSRTRFALTWFQQYGFNAGPFGDANTIANARDVSVDGVAKAGVLESKGGKVRLLRRDELPEDWDPWADRSLTVWEGTQHVIRRLEGEGEDSAARVVKRLGPYADMTEKLAYRLYQICERKGWADEARAYNGLVVAWPSLVNIAATLADETTPGPAQAELAV